MIANSHFVNSLFQPNVPTMSPQSNIILPSFLHPFTYMINNVEEWDSFQSWLLANQYQFQNDGMIDVPLLFNKQFKNNFCYLFIRKSLYQNIPKRHFLLLYIKQILCNWTFFFLVDLSVGIYFKCFNFSTRRTAKFWCKHDVFCSYQDCWTLIIWHWFWISYSEILTEVVVISVCSVDLNWNLKRTSVFRGKFLITKVIYFLLYFYNLIINNALITLEHRRGICKTKSHSMHVIWWYKPR